MVSAHSSRALLFYVASSCSPAPFHTHTLMLFYVHVDACTTRHPDRHQGNSKVAAEAKFKELQQAYQLLQQPGALSAAARGEPNFSAGLHGRKSHKRFIATSLQEHDMIHNSRRKRL